MKKAILFFLLLAGTANLLHAQYQNLSVSEQIFGYPKPGKSSVSFSFVLPDKKKMILEFTHVSQLEYLPNLDSMVKVAIAMLEPLKDSLQSDGIVRRVDLWLPVIPKIRIISHPESANIYTIKDKEIMQLKVDQDTVRIIGHALSRHLTVINDLGKKEEVQEQWPFVMMFLVNNIKDLSTISPTAIQECVAVLKPKVEHYYNWDQGNNIPLNFQSEFNMVTGRQPIRVNPRFRIEDQGWNGMIGFGMTAVRGSIVPSVQAGFTYTINTGYFKSKFALYAELQPFFSRDLANKLTIDNNRFLVFQFRQIEKSENEHTFSLQGNITLGYLFSRRGEWYEPNTFKLGLPILATKHITIEPQLIFNGFFKNVTPSIKLCFNF